MMAAAGKERIMTREKAFELAMQACKETWNEKTCAEIIKALEQEPTDDATLKDIFCMGCEYREQESCEDAISRQAVLEKAGYTETEEGWCGYTVDVDYIKSLPPVTPQPTGHWIQTNEFFINQDGQFIYKFICSECKSLSYFRKSNKKAIGANVCPNCGAKMVEPKERSE